MIFNFVYSLLLFLVQTDTLTQAYSDKWSGAEADQSVFAGFMTSNDMIFVVLGVSLIIWFTLLFFISRTEKKLASLEKELRDSK